MGQLSGCYIGVVMVKCELWIISYVYILQNTMVAGQGDDQWGKKEKIALATGKML